MTWENSCHSNSLLFSFRNARISRDFAIQFLHLAVMGPQREKILSTSACDAGADRRPRASGPMSLYVVILCNQNSIQFPMSKFASVSWDMYRHCFLVIATGLFSAWCCCLQLICQESEFVGEACCAFAVLQSCCSWLCGIRIQFAKKFLILIPIFVLYFQFSF